MPKLVVTGEFALELVGAVPGKLEVLAGTIGVVPELVIGTPEDKEPVPMGAVPELEPVKLEDEPVPIGAVPVEEPGALGAVLLGKLNEIEELPLGAVVPDEPDPVPEVVAGEVPVELGTGAVPVPKPELLSVPVRGKLL